MRHFLVPALAFSIASFPALVKAASAHAESKTKGLSFKAFVQKSIKDAPDHTLLESTAKHLGFAGAMQGKSLEVLGDQTSDGRIRDVEILVEKITDSQDYRPISVLIHVKSKTKTDATVYWFKLSPSGVLEKAYLDEFKYDENGKPVAGSAAWTDLEVGKKDVKAALKYEMDFWLKGMYRAAGSKG